MPKKQVSKDQSDTESMMTSTVSDGGIPKPSELEHLHALYAELKALGVNSISDLEVKIARLQS